jgi:hypothetical protein
MLTCFDLQSGTDLDTFRRTLADYTAHMRGLDLLESTGPIGRRQRDTILDTDSERDHEHFFIMTFRDRAQADAAVDYIKGHEEPGDSIHKAAYAKIRDPVFICWQDT